MKRALIAAIILVLWYAMAAVIAAHGFQPVAIEVIPATATPFPSLTISVPSTYTPTATATVTQTFTQTPTATATPTETPTVPTQTPSGYRIEVFNIWSGSIEIQIGEVPK